MSFPRKRKTEDLRFEPSNRGVEERIQKDLTEEKEAKRRRSDQLDFKAKLYASLSNSESTGRSDGQQVDLSSFLVDFKQKSQRQSKKKVEKVQVLNKPIKLSEEEQRAKERIKDLYDILKPLPKSFKFPSLSREARRELLRTRIEQQRQAEQ
mmetsp:Transcript_6427/g.7352  ORF Transcript_6427/g.7352 Transcript_6427/m.7352 type:complete len:152 (+) Transcript_6427:236-691(+)